VHWHGPKNGLISFLPKSEVLQFFEAFYYSRIKNGTTKMYWRRFTRTFRHLSAFTYEVLKKMYLAIKPR